MSWIDRVCYRLSYKFGYKDLTVYALRSKIHISHPLTRLWYCILKMIIHESAFISPNLLSADEGSLHAGAAEGASVDEDDLSLG